MPVAAIVPIRSFRTGKDRLSSGLDPAARQRLGRVMAERTADAAEEAMLLPAIVTSDPEVMAWASGKALPTIAETGQGLNSAAADGVDWAGHNGLEWIVLHSDLPLVTALDLAELESAASRGVSFVAPSADGGTTAISAPVPVAFSYGPASATRHIARLRDPQIFVSLGLLHDLDSVSDLTSATHHPLGKWLVEVGGLPDELKPNPDGKT